jgi:hypothetical protein
MCYNPSTGEVASSIEATTVCEDKNKDEKKLIQVSGRGDLIHQAPLCFFYFSYSLFYDKIKIKIKMFLGKRPKGYYQKAYKILIEAKKKSLKQHDDAERSTLEIKKRTFGIFKFS